MNQVFISFHDDLDVAKQYDDTLIHQAVDTTLQVMSQKLDDGLVFAYFDDADDYWHKPKSLDIYITNATEGRQLNLDARGKDYATNILSYPSQMPADVLMMIDEVVLGELIICHEVLQKEACEQQKTFESHLVHLLVHGVLHLLGFDHEISDADADEMEGFEVEILAKLGYDDPYREG